MFSRLLSTLSLVVALAGVSLAATASPSQAAREEGKKKIVFVHGKASHGYGGHAYGPAFRMLARILNKNVPAVTGVVIRDDTDLAVLDTADAIVLGSDGGRLVKSLGDRLEPLMEKGVGLACIHYTLDPTDPKAVSRLIDWIGGAYQRHWSVNPHWEADFRTFPDHPVARGLEPFKAQDEWYYHMRFAKDMKGVTPILSAVPPESTRQGRDGPHSGNPDVRARGRLGLRAAGWRPRFRVHRHAHALDLGAGQLPQVGPQRLGMDRRGGGPRRRRSVQDADTRRAGSRSWYATAEELQRRCHSGENQVQTEVCCR